MDTFPLKADQPFIELNKLLKAVYWVGTGGEANMRIENQEVIVNEMVETRKRKKLIPGDVVVFGGKTVTITL
jgi:ribosome-associated protein